MAPTETIYVGVKKLTDPQKSLTEAHRSGGLIIVVEQASGSSITNTRRIPYVEQYRQRSALYETPIERLQRAVDASREPAETPG